MPGVLSTDETSRGHVITMRIARRIAAIALACGRPALALTAGCLGSQDAAAQDAGSQDASAGDTALEAAADNPSCAPDATYGFPHCGGVCCNGACVTDDAGASVCMCGSIVGGCSLDPHAIQGECCFGQCLNTLQCAP